VIAAVGTVFAAAYLLWLYQRTAFGEPNPDFVGHGHGQPTHAVGAAVNDDVADDDDHDVHIYDVTPTEWIAWTPLLVLIVVLGVYPQLLFKVTDPAVTEMVGRLGTHLGG